MRTFDSCYIIDSCLVLTEALKVVSFQIVNREGYTHSLVQF